MGAQGAVGKSARSKAQRHTCGNGNLSRPRRIACAIRGLGIAQVCHAKGQHNSAAACGEKNRLAGIAKGHCHTGSDGRADLREALAEDLGNDRSRSWQDNNDLNLRGHAESCGA